MKTEGGQRFFTLRNLTNPTGRDDVKMYDRRRQKFISTRDGVLLEPEKDTCHKDRVDSSFPNPSVFIRQYL